MSRKYRQRGYQDEGRAERSSRRQGSREPAGPGGRGLGRPRATASRCARCGERPPAGVEIAPASRCTACGSDLHTCTNCRHFDTGAINECRAGVEPRIAKKASRNDCASFEVKEVAESEERGDADVDARTAFDALFEI